MALRERDVNESLDPSITSGEKQLANTIWIIRVPAGASVR